MCGLLVSSSQEQISMFRHSKRRILFQKEIERELYVFYIVKMFLIWIFCFLKVLPDIACMKYETRLTQMDDKEADSSDGPN